MNVLIAGLLACGCVSLVDAPLWPPAGDYINAALDCGDSSNAVSCETTRKTWTRDFDDAIAGKFQAQTTVARCLSTGCDGAIRIDPILGCAWRTVAMATPRSADDVNDIDGLPQYCGKPYLDAAGARAAEAEARTLQQMLDVK